MNFISSIVESKAWNQPIVTAVISGAVPVALTTLAVIPKTRKYIAKYCKKIWWKHFPGQLNIALAIQSKEGLNSGLYFQEIKRGLLEAIEQLGLVARTPNFVHRPCILTS